MKKNPFVPMARPKPLKDGSAFYIEITWLDGRMVYVDKFGSETTARDWIERDFPAFLREKLAH